jgi:hypothetical protein
MPAIELPLLSEERWGRAAVERIAGVLEGQV